jgi:hypothetical protein
MKDATWYDGCWACVRFEPESCWWKVWGLQWGETSSAAASHHRAK